MVFCLLVFCCCIFFFKQKTAYEMRISDWSSDVCSSDLGAFALTCAALLPMGSGRKAVRVAAIFNSEFQGMIDEADLSAEQPGAGTPPRLPLADGDSGRPQGDPRAPGARPTEENGSASCRERGCQCG